MKLSSFSTACCLLLGLLSPAAFAQVQITEFMASNTRTLADDYGDYSDWIEIYNDSQTPVNLYGWHLTDSAGNLSKWQFPSTNLPPKSYLMVFASNRNRRTPGAALHTNFELKASGEYLALVRPDGSIATQFSPEYPPQMPDVSFGFGTQAFSQTAITTGAVGRVKIPLDASLGRTWTSNDFDHASWAVATNGIGFGTNSGYAALIQSDVRAAMQHINGSAFLRLPFSYTNTTPPEQLTLRMKFDDGFAAWLNGAPAAAANAPVDPEWDSTATAFRPPASAMQFAEYDLTSLSGLLVTGANTLAIQGLNLTASDNSFLALAELAWNGVAYQSEGRYFVVRTPGSLNGTGAKDLGPILTFAGHFPNTPAANQSLIITCKVAQAFAPVTNLTLNWRVMFGVTNRTTLLDDGLHGDGTAGDGVYGAVIAPGNYTAGQMVRWHFTAADSLGRASRWPLFENPTETAE
ncbi:MAG TPA: lamin tail domain-containing protein, partial [Verrucomicrobiae bacterium]